MVKKEDRAKMIYLPLSKKWVDGVDGEKEIIQELTKLNNQMIEYRQSSIYHRDVVYNLREQIKIHEKYILGEYMTLR